MSASVRQVCTNHRENAEKAVEVTSKKWIGDRGKSDLLELYA